MATVHSRKYHVRDLATRSVTLLPAQAQVVRDVSDVPLKLPFNPQPAAITIVGLSPTVDEDSIKVEGTGSALITDITIKLLPNRDVYEDIFPDEDDDSDEDDTDSEYEGPAESVEYKDAEAKLQTQRKQREAVLAVERIFQDQQNSAAMRLEFLNSWGKSLDRKNCPDIDQALQTYKQEREKLAAESKKASDERRGLQAVLESLREEQSLLNLEKEAESVRQRGERMLFWPIKCYTVLVTLEVVGKTPGSSRRSSLASDTASVATDKTSGELGDAMLETTCSLSLSYLTSWAFWAPSYDLAFSTASNSGRLYFDAQITNQTSETWENCKMMLSTSRTALCGAGSDVPELKPWDIRLAPRSKKWDDALDSQEERRARMIGHKPATNTKLNRDELFGEERETFAYAREEEEEEEGSNDQEFRLFDEPTVRDADMALNYQEPSPLPILEFQEPSFEEAGLTATYELPGQKTLAPAPTASKSRIATIAFANVVFSHTVVAKYKPVMLSVLDQVPVSQDERLRVDIALPRGLLPGGKGVPAGEQKGEIVWDVTLNPGKGVELLLEYEVACPAGEHVEQKF
ncbi:hypothetical protein PpBr36_03981 [Pyricularia pennisetigena]|uniref:hypothetical protein n=1 Tax=Pyricularia pennisetigena TaxID=1578925 RepID=UPI001153604C|nr:hypothetical protein PpBr36_03981 [Pyricularia pennisetigena]TLS27405.1 hypothetical protein PpBr36_03981 [Pyricularia pennisetigena]